MAKAETRHGVVSHDELLALGGTYASLWDAFTGGQEFSRSGSLASTG